MSFVVACSQSANPSRPSPVTVAAQVVEWSAVASGNNSTMGVVSADATAAPANLNATVSSTTVTLTWTSSPGATSYIIEAGTGAGLTNITSFDTGGPGTILTVPNVPNGTFYVRVRARSADGTSGPSNEVNFTVGGGGTCDAAPNAPTNLTSSLNGNVLTLTWSAPVGGCPAESYVIEGGLTPSGIELANVDTGSTSTTFSADIGPATFTTFYVRTKARNPRGRSLPSNTATVTRSTSTPNPLPPAPRCGSTEYANARLRCSATYPVSGPGSACLAVCWRNADAWYDNGRGCQPAEFIPAC